MDKDELLRKRYFKWLLSKVCDISYPSQPFSKLLTHLHRRTFIYLSEMDGNRARNGEYLRYRFGQELNDNSLEEQLGDNPCTILEMMVALAIKCEESIMHEDELGDRTPVWFWGMVKSLGLYSMDDERYKRVTVEAILYRFLYREYKPNGKGGLFTLKHPEYDMREVEIWYQMNYYLNELLDL